MKHSSLHKTLSYISAVCIILALGSCKNTKSYADLLRDETHAVNYFLANHRVESSVPSDGKYITVEDAGDNAPYYRINDNLYMQVVYPGNPDDMAEEDQMIYFRFTRYNMREYWESRSSLPIFEAVEGEGNSNDLAVGATSFRFGNTVLASTSTFGYGIQEPLKYLGIGCQVNLVVKSQSGPSSEISSVIPFLYNIRYFNSPI